MLGRLRSAVSGFLWLLRPFFVRDGLVTPDKFLDPVVQYHYSPPGFGPYLGGHPPAADRL